MKKIILLFSMFCMITIGYTQKMYELQSPDAKLAININVAKDILFSVAHDNDLMIENSPISMTLSTGEVWGKNAQVSNALITSED